MANKKELLKKSFKVVATIGAGIILREIIKNQLPKDLHPIKKIAVTVGEYVISDILIEAVAVGADKCFNEAVSMFKKTQK